MHGIDYYAGKEFAEPTQFKLRADATRTLRGPRPEEADKPSEAEGVPTLIEAALSCFFLQGPKSNKTFRQGRGSLKAMASSRCGEND